MRRLIEMIEDSLVGDALGGVALLVALICGVWVAYGVLQ